MFSSLTNVTQEQLCTLKLNHQSINLLFSFLFFKSVSFKAHSNTHIA